LSWTAVKLCEWFYIAVFVTINKIIEEWRRCV